MKNIWKISFLHSLGVLVYVSLVSLIMSNAEELFGKEENFTSPIVFLLLFSLSALVVGGLILIKPFMLYQGNKKKDALTLLFATGGFLALFTILAMIIASLR
jgi:hypothetical protein